MAATSPQGNGAGRYARLFNRGARQVAAHACAGFTLIELLVVIAIVLALAVAIVPNIGAGISGTQLSTPSRSILQAARYARTMAILHPIETELVLVSAAEGARLGASSDGKLDPRGARIEVRIAEETMRLARAEAAEADADAATTDEGESDEATGAFAEDEEGIQLPGVAAGVASTGAALGDLAAEVHATFPCGTVAFEFVRFTDEDEEEDPDSEVLRRAQEAATGKAKPDRDGFDDEEGATDEDDASERTISFLFDSDGICRPFDLLLKDSPDADESDSLTISIDRWGRGIIEGRDDD